ncbi:MAG: ATP--guanido phosphotransferase [Kiritimatiellaeota bacterium]|nr:ATP--guanido phosphotransferase [Kiritimatiellota bacterium]
MHAIIQQLCGRLPAWMSKAGHDAPEGAVAVSTRVRLARNLGDVPFPGRAAQAVRRQVWGRLCALAGELFETEAPAEMEMVELAPAEREVLLERRLVSSELCSCGEGSGVLLRSDESVALLVNEEDHVRIQALLPGLQLAEAYRCSEQVDATFCRSAPVAFSERFGFLTACPTNAGTGMRASVMLHLPGLVLTERMESVVRAIGELGEAVRGVHGEGSEAVGHFFQISNQSTLGESETEILERLDHLIRDLVWQELNARRHLVRHERTRLLDYVGRALGVLRHAYRVSGRESLAHLSALRLGALLGLFRTLEAPMIEELILHTRPGHLQVRVGREMDEAERDEARAAVIRKALTPEKIGAG